MNMPPLTAKLAVLALMLPAICSAQTYSWIDDDGVTHFGDRIPPEYADRDRRSLNGQGITIDRHQSITEEQRAEQERLAAEEQARKAQEQHDRYLLQSYTRIDDIEATRERRLKELDARIANTEKLLEETRARLIRLRQNASRYKPYSTDENARDIPTTLADNINQSETALTEYETLLARYRADRGGIVESFAKDISRFKTLKGF